MVRIHPFGRDFPRALSEPDAFAEIDGASRSIAALKREMRRVARDPHVTVLITGESGTGKERVAEAIHRASSRAGAPFVVIDCAGLSPTLAEDALFGHMRGAFTGAVDDRAGPFERGDGGTVLLDEIGDLPLEVQMKLLRAIQSRTVQRLGGAQSRRFDVRIMAATHVDLAAAVARGTFREDLFYRLQVYEIAVPALRHRGPDDIAALTSAIVFRLAQRRGRPAPGIDAEVIGTLARYRWPGNVRELENVLERMLVAAGSETLSARHLPRRLRTTDVAAAATSNPLPAMDAVREALQRSGFKYGRTAAGLGLSRHQLYRLLRRYGIRAPGSHR